MTPIVTRVYLFFLSLFSYIYLVQHLFVCCSSEIQAATTLFVEFSNFTIYTILVPNT